QRMYTEPGRRREMALAARRSAERYAWPRVASEVERVYEEVQRAAEPAGALEAAARGAGILPAAGAPRVRPRRLPSLDPEPARAAPGLAGVLAVALTALAAHRIGVQNVLASILRSDAGWVLLATGLMMSAMLLRAVSWYAIARSALPRNRLRRRDVTSATMIGVLMSAT